MFKWMISGHRGHKSKGGKLNNGNNNWNNNNNNGVKKNLNNNKKAKPADEIQPEDNSGFQQTNISNEYLNSTDSPNQSGQLSSNDQSGAICRLQSSQEQPNHLQQSEQQQRFAQFQQQQRNYRNSQNNLLGNSRDTLDDSNEYTTLEQLHLQPGGHMDQNYVQRVKSVEQLSGNQSLPPSLPSSGLNGDRVEPPLLTTSSGTRPSNSLAIGSQPNLNQYSSHHDSLQLNMFSNPLPEAPGTCTLPRRSAMKEEINARYRCPSNPPTHNRLVPPPYSRHQFPENSSTLRRVYQPPPPPPPPRIVQEAKSPYKHLPQKLSATFPEPSKKLETEFHQLNHNNPSTVFSALDQHSNDFVRQQEDPLRSIEPYPRSGTKQADNLALPSKSTEDLLNASRVPNCSLLSSSNKVIQIQNYELHQTKSNPIQIDVNNKDLTEVLSSDSIYPSGTPSQGRYEPITVRTTPSTKQIEESSNFSTFQDHRRKDLSKRNGEQQTMKPVSMDAQTVLTWDRHFQGNGKETFSGNHSKGFQVESRLASRDQFHSDHHLWGRSKDSSMPKRDIVNSNYFDNRNDLFICEEEDRKSLMLGRARSSPIDNADAFWSYQKSAQEDQNDFRQRQIPCNKQETSREGPRFGREGFTADGADSLTVKDSPTYPSLDRRSFQKFSELEKKEKKNDFVGDSSSSSWMEWTQQLKAYVAWVNSQLRKRPDQLPVTDLRRDFQNGVVFADLIEIISGERISGIIRGADTLQLCRENLDRILQFMAAKRIRMTHITSKEITEGNLKSIMRVILALAAHYKPQSVREGSHSQEQESLKQQTSLVVNSQIKSTPKKTHDIGVGPDKPLPSDKSPDKTPNLPRRNLNDHRDNDDEEEEENTEFMPLRRQPSLINALRPSSPNPVYENLLPKRASQNRWAYDSLRASHKFYWGGCSSPSSTRRHREKKVTSSTPQKGVNLLDDDDENMNSTLNTRSSECTSLNTSVDVDVNGRQFDENIGTTSFIQKVNKPAALDFWQGLQGHEREEMKKTPEVEADSPFRYHTIHRMSGRRKLPQIPGQSCSSSSNSRVTTPLGLNSGPASDISQCGFDDTFDRSRDASGAVMGVENGGNISDETSREPEGRSQNSSPAASVARDPLFDSWRQVFGQENIKHGLREGSLRKEGRDVVSKLFTNDEEASVLRQEVIKHVLTKKALENEKEELSNHIYQKENQISELRKQLLQKEKTLHHQRIQFDEAIRSIQNTKSFRPVNGESSSIRYQDREELQLVREAISALRSNFRGTDPNQHTLDTLEQAIAVLMERGVAPTSATADVASKSDSRCLNGSGGDTFTKVIYFTDRTVTPFMSSIGKRIGDVTLRDFKEIFDRPGSFRFHFKSQDPEYGLVKEEVINDDDILPGVDGKIIAWVQEDQE